MKLSVTIITLNEEKNIERAILSAAFADEVVVIDSGSQDRTVEIAQSLGAKVFHHPFVNHGNQKNYAASQALGEWIFSLDADEEISKELQENILETLSATPAQTIFYINRLTSFCGRWIRHGGWFPDHIIRLYQKENACFTEPTVHEKVTALDGKQISVQKLDGLLYHYSFPTIASQVNINVKYARMGAAALKQNLSPFSCFSKMILKPPFKFLECYILKKGFLDGVPGFIIAINAAHSIFMKFSMKLLKRDL